MKSRFFLPAVILLGTPLSVLAQTIKGTVESVGSGLPGAVNTSLGCAGQACGFVNITAGVMENLRPLVFIIAVFLITVAGFRMITTEEEESFTKSKRIISASITGVMLAYLVEPFVNAFYGGLGQGPLAGVFGGIGIGSVPSANVRGGASILHAEVEGVIRWTLVIIGILTVFMIIISGFKAMTKAGSEEGLKELRHTVFYVIAGVLLIIFTEIIAQTFGLTTTGVRDPGSPDIDPAAMGLVRVLNFVLGFMALIAVVVIIFAGFQMILNLGNEEQFKKARSLIFRVIIGLLVIGVSWVLINFVIGLVL